MSIEAMKQALEALDMCSVRNEDVGFIEQTCDTLRVAIASYSTAINAAELREEAEQERSSVKQEPVATVVSENKPVTMSWWHEPALPVGTKLYTTPPHVATPLAAQPAPVKPVGTVKDLFTQAAWERLDVCGSTKVYLDTAPAAPVQDIQEKCRIETVPAKGGLLPTRPATREEKIVNPGVYEVPVQGRVWPEKLQDRLRDEWYNFEPEVDMSDFSKSVYWLENSTNTRDKLASKELRRLHEDNIRLKKCLFQMQEAAKQIAAQPAPVQEEIQRLSALVRAQQITIEKLEAQRQFVGLADEQKRELVTDWFAEGWAIKAAHGMLDNYDTLMREKNTGEKK